MSRSIFYLTALACACLAHTTNAQTRAIAAGAFVLDDGAGHTVTIVAPASMSTSYTYTLPSAPTAGIASGSTPGQMLYWDGANWTPMNYAFFNGTSIGLGFPAPPAALAFPITLDGTIGPSADSAIDIGDATHRIRNVYAANIIGAATPLAVTAVPFDSVRSGTSAAALWIGNGGALRIAGTGVIEASKVKGAGSTSDAVDLATAEVNGVLPIGSGGTGASSASGAINNLLPLQSGDSGKVLQSDGANVHWATIATTGSVSSVALTVPSEFAVTGSPITSSGTLSVTKVTQPANLIYAGPTGGGPAAPTFRSLVSADIPNNAANTTGTSANVTGLVAVDHGGTGLTTFVGANRMLYSSGATGLALLAPGNPGDVLSLNGLGSPTWTPPAPGLTSISFDSVWSGTSITALHIGSGGSLTPTGTGIVEATRLKGSGSITDAVDLSTGEVNGVLALANGGTGAASATAAINNLLPSQSGDSGKVLQSDGTNVHWVPAASGGSVSSVGVTTPSEFIVTGSPVTSNGTIAITKAVQPAHSIYAGPDTGSSAVPTFRALVSSDIPNNAANTTGTASNVTGTVAIANGGTGAISATGAINNLLPSQSGDSGKVLQSDGANVHWVSAASGGSVSSVGVTTPSEFIVTGSPVTSSGTIAITKAVQPAHTIYAGPDTGSSGVPTFRALVSSDIPDNAANTSGTAANVTGTVGIANGGTGQITASAAFTALSPMTTYGDIIYAGEGGIATALHGNVSAGRRFLSETGNGFNASAPSWETINNSDLANSRVTITPGVGLTGGGSVQLGDTIVLSNAGVTSLNGTANEIIASSSTGAITLSTPQPIATTSTPTFAGLTLGTPLTVGNGGSGASSLSGVVHGNGSAAFTAGAVDLTSEVSDVLPVSHGGTGVDSASAHAIFAGPTTASGPPSFRALSASDIPSLSTSYIVNSSSAQAGASFNVSGTGAVGSTLRVGPLSIDASDQFGVSASGSTTLGGIGVISGDQGLSIGSRTIGKELRLYATGSGPVTVSTNGSERARIDGAGNVGIGTSSPGARVDIKDGSLLLSNSGSPSQLQLQGSGPGITSLAAGAQGDTTINYTLPASRPNANDVLTASTIVGSGPYAVTLGWSSATGGSGTGWSLTGNAGVPGNYLGTTNAQDVIVKTNAIERLRILSSGKVGIGAPSPSELLEVRDGNVRLSNSGTPRQLQLQGNSTGVTTFEAGAQGSATISYTLPTAQGSSGSMLTNNGSGSLSWSRVGQVLFGRRTENFNVTSSSLQSDTSLVVQLDTNAVYTFESFLSVSDVNAAGVSVSIGIIAPTGSSIKWGYVNPSSALGVGGTTKTASGAETGGMTMLGASEMDLWVRGIVVTGSTSGGLQIRMRKTAGGTATDAVRMNVNSYLQAMRVR